MNCSCYKFNDNVACVSCHCFILIKQSLHHHHHHRNHHHHHLYIPCSFDCQKRNIPKHIRRSYISNNTSLPYFYHLIKTHKLDQGIKIRPLVSNTNGPTTRLSWLSAGTLKPLLKQVPAHLENSMQLIKRIQQTESEIRKETPYPYSLDVVSLYTSIPIQEAIQATLELLLSKIGPFTRQDVQELLNVHFKTPISTYNRSFSRFLDSQWARTYRAPLPFCLIYTNYRKRRTQYLPSLHPL